MVIMLSNRNKLFKKVKLLLFINSVHFVLPEIHSDDFSNTTVLVIGIIFCYISFNMYRLL